MIKSMRKIKLIVAVLVYLTYVPFMMKNSNFINCFKTKMQRHLQQMVKSAGYLKISIDEMKVGTDISLSRVSYLNGP